MARVTRSIWAWATVLGCVAVALLFLPTLLSGYEANETPRREPVAAKNGLVVHEWGTFTSFAGSDGVNLEFRPLVSSDLPRFVMRPSSQPGELGYGLAKDKFVALQRMETPVTYFYTNIPRTVNVRVDFPEGLLTEWYPVVKDYAPTPPNPQASVLGPSHLDWGNVRLTPAEEFDAVQVRDAKEHAVMASLPAVRADNPYGRARETDSAIVETVDVNGGSHFEKFLFYRGVGNFDLPMRLSALGGDRFEIANNSSNPSGALLMVRIEQGAVRFVRADPLGRRSAVEVTLPETHSSVYQLTEAIVEELVAAGLYEKEAVAMVNTWRTSWFGEDGTRLLYLVPEKLTDELLPLLIDPVPDETVRVLVGRLETITPEDCRRLAGALIDAAENEARLNAAIRRELKPLGRFAEPALKFVVDQSADTPSRERLEAILADLQRTRFAILRVR